MITQLFPDYNPIQSKRRVFLLDSHGARPAWSIGEFLSEEQSNTVDTVSKPQSGFEAETIRGNPDALEAARMGISEKLALTMERDFGRPAGEVVIEESIHQRERQMTKREMENERLRQSWIGSKWSKLWGCTLNNTIGLFSENYDEIGIRMRMKYARNTTELLLRPPVRSELQKKYVLAEEVWDGLNPGQRNDVNRALMGAGVRLPPVPRPAFFTNFGFGRLACSSYNQLLQVQQACPFLLIRNPFTRSERFPVRPETAFGRLMKLTATTDEATRDSTANTVYGNERLQGFLDGLETSDADTHTMLTELLNEDALFALERTPEAQALVGKLVFRNRFPPTPTLRDELTRIRGQLPELSSEQGLSAEQKEQQTKVMTHLTTMQKTHNSLNHSYMSALSIGQNINKLNTDIDTVEGDIAAEQARLAGLGRRRDSDLENLKNLREEKNKMTSMLANYTAKQDELRKSIAEMEADHLSSIEDILVQLEEILDTIPAAAVTITRLSGLLPMNISTDADLFGPATGAWVAPGSAPPQLKHHVLHVFRGRDYRLIQNEIDEHYFEPLATKRQRLTCRELLVFLNEGDMYRAGHTNPEERLRLADMSAALAIADAENLQLPMSLNQELAERVGGKTLLSNRLDRLRKFMIAKMTDKQIYTARDVIDPLATRDKRFQVFYKMPQDITLAELRDRMIAHNVSDPAVLTEYNFMLLEVLKSFEILQTNGKAEIHDGDAMDIYKLIRRINKLIAEIRSISRYDQIKKEGGNKTELIIKKMREDDAATRQQEQEILSRVGDPEGQWKQMLDKYILRKNTLPALVDARQFIEENKLSGYEAEKLLWDRGLKGSSDMFGRGLALASAIYTGRETAQWTWNKIVKPIGYYGLVKPAEYALWKPVSWSGRKFGSIFSWAGRILKIKK